MTRTLVTAILLLGCVQPSLAGNWLFHGADPSAHVWQDGRMWIYPTTDKEG